MSQHLIQLLLPLSDNNGEPFSRSEYVRVRSELTEQFGGMTAFTRGPAEGLWEENGETARDDIVVFEVMTPELDASWWDRYRRALENRFKQDSIVVRAQEIWLL
ncbi:hypothetical protein [Methylobacterium oxalidis]|uniref:DUF1330 domain-containing protein n=1 Tax=Methylobacterium oxalidis TaxID=944322 RepID=A0A512J1U2_9HYPH|nr:hypothetical protein [Methylobacterium oxalidis]GEP03829.1 hypothetical protein MOX02_18670 [Methylobacterium oxalidis]GJE31297.1 hypothetical protein LDDCCGHA_1474 [Methylobacterium oxalidis]GLS65313.1 hypothetical protein GCM10007888_36950 [Methylobacterium oxalidis]